MLKNVCLFFAYFRTKSIVVRYKKLKQALPYNFYLFVQKTEAVIKQATILVILLILLFDSVSAQLIRMNNRLVIAGIVVDAETTEPLPYVNIYVKHSRKGTITDTSGYFVLFANIGDTIVFSSIGYEKLLVTASDSTGDISRSAYVEMEKTVYELSSVDIIALRRYEQFRYEITHMVLPEDDYQRALQNFPLRPADLDYYSRHGTMGFGIVLSPITALYDAFSKEGKERRKLEEIQERDLIKNAVGEKFNVAMVMRITGLSEAEAIAFIEWMALPDRFVLNTAEYQLIEVIMMQFVKYSRTQ